MRAALRVIDESNGDVPIAADKFDADGEVDADEARPLHPLPAAASPHRPLPPPFVADLLRSLPIGGRRRRQRRAAVRRRGARASGRAGAGGRAGGLHARRDGPAPPASPPLLTRARRRWRPQCRRAYHLRCLSPPLAPSDVPEGDEGWLCPSCDAKVDALYAINGDFDSAHGLATPWGDVFPEADAKKKGALAAERGAAADDEEEEWPGD